MLFIAWIFSNLPFSFFESFFRDSLSIKIIKKNNKSSYFAIKFVIKIEYFSFSFFRANIVKKVNKIWTIRSE